MRIKVISAVLLMYALLAPGAHAQLTAQRSNLKGLPAVYLRVERVLPASLPYGLDPAKMREDFAERLQDAGVKLMSGAEDALLRNETLLVDIQVKQAPKERMLDYFVAVRLLEEVELRGARREAITWERIFLGGTGSQDTEAVKDVASSLLDEFIRDFRSANRNSQRR